MCRFRWTLGASREVPGDALWFQLKERKGYFSSSERGVWIPLLSPSLSSLLLSSHKVLRDRRQTMGGESLPLYWVDLGLKEFITKTHYFFFSDLLPLSPASHTVGAYSFSPEVCKRSFREPGSTRTTMERGAWESSLISCFHSAYMVLIRISIYGTLRTELVGGLSPCSWMVPGWYGSDQMSTAETQVIELPV